MQAEAVQVLQQLLRFNTVNPPGAERAAQEYLAGLLRGAGLEVTLAGPDPERPNLVARLRGRAPGPVLGLLSHVDTVGADPVGWRHDPWSGALDDGCVWGRGALDMKSQTAAEVVAVTTLARSGWRPAAGDLVLIRVDGRGGRRHRRDLALRARARSSCAATTCSTRATARASPVGDERFYGVSLGEKGVFRFTLHTDGVAGHASMPNIADNALLKLAPLLERMGARRPGWDVTPGPAALFSRLGLPLDGGGPDGGARGAAGARARARAARGADAARDARAHPRGGRR